ncbi:MAG TPA: cytochrome c, partial [Acidobacteriaceae bacterium]|nr:cytochrome c [Acidobacteriaceae bacterium]
MRRANPFFAPVIGSCVFAAITVALAGCHSAPSSNSRELTPAERQGRAIFQANCAPCHLANSSSGLHGPSLQGLFKKPYLPSGAPANDDRVRATILHGRNMMPPFAYSLDDRQI